MPRLPPRQRRGKPAALVLLLLAALALAAPPARALDERGRYAAARMRVAPASARECARDGARSVAAVTLRVALHGAHAGPLAAGEAPAAYIVRLANVTLAPGHDCVHLEALPGGEATLHARGLGYASVMTPHLLVKVRGAARLDDAAMRVAACVHDVVGDDEFYALPHAAHVSVLVQHAGTQARNYPVPLRDAGAEARRIDGRRYVDFELRPLHTRTYVQLARVPDPHLYRLLQESRAHVGTWLGLTLATTGLAALSLVVACATLALVARRLPAPAPPAAPGAGWSFFGAARGDGG